MIQRRVPARTGREQHRGWLELVDADGPFLAVPPLARVWPQGMPPLAEPARQALMDAKPDVERAWDAWDRHRGDDASPAAYRLVRDAWVEVVLRDVLGWGELWSPADPVAATAAVTSPDRAVTASPTGALRLDDHVGALVWVVDPVSSLRDLCDDPWASTPIDRMELMLRGGGVPIGLVTDGRWWAIVSAAPEVLAASGVVDSQTWVEEAGVRNAFGAAQPSAPAGRSRARPSAAAVRGVGPRRRGDHRVARHPGAQGGRAGRRGLRRSCP